MNPNLFFMIQTSLFDERCVEPENPMWTLFSPPFFTPGEHIKMPRL